jgi:hypothetical protein
MTAPFVLDIRELMTGKKCPCVADGGGGRRGGRPGGGRRRLDLEIGMQLAYLLMTGRRSKLRRLRGFRRDTTDA